MRDYWLTQYALSALGWGYISLALATLALALWLPRGWLAKAVTAAIVLVLASILPVRGYQEYAVQRQLAEEFNTRHVKAKALFDERCKMAGERIHKTLGGIDEIALLKVRPKRINFGDQYVLDDPYGRDVGADGYIASFLRPVDSIAAGQGYRYVDIAEPSAPAIRYELIQKASQAGNPYTELRQVGVATNAARFGIDYEDISLATDREHWIAGGRTRIVDVLSKEVLAERIGFLFDPALGNTEGGRRPWEAAITCRNEDRKYGHNARFAMRVLKPKEGK
jgi:hypothetical protein